MAGTFEEIKATYVDFEVVLPNGATETLNVIYGGSGYESVKIDITKMLVGDKIFTVPQWTGNEIIDKQLELDLIQDITEYLSGRYLRSTRSQCIKYIREGKHSVPNEQYIFKGFNEIICSPSDEPKQVLVSPLMTATRLVSKLTLRNEYYDRIKVIGVNKFDEIGIYTMSPRVAITYNDRNIELHAGTMFGASNTGIIRLNVDHNGILDINATLIGFKKGTIVIPEIQVHVGSVDLNPNIPNSLDTVINSVKAMLAQSKASVLVDEFFSINSITVGTQKMKCNLSRLGEYTSSSFIFLNLIDLIWHLHRNMINKPELINDRPANIIDIGIMGYEYNFVRFTMYRDEQTLSVQCETEDNEFKTLWVYFDNPNEFKNIKYNILEFILNHTIDPARPSDTCYILTDTLPEEAVSLFEDYKIGRACRSLSSLVEHIEKWILL